MALIDPAFEKSIFRTVREEYLKAFPLLESKYMAVICDTADGVTIQ